MIVHDQIMIEMKTSAGGTRIYCPNCGVISACKAIPTPDVNGYSDSDYSQTQMFRHKDLELHWFQRGRRCLGCGHEFVTAEIDFNALSKLLIMRVRLSAILANTDFSMDRIEKSIESLEVLNKFLLALNTMNHEATNQSQE